MGDVLAQTVTMEKGGKYDRGRVTRAAIFGTVLLGPLGHLHFNFMEWLIVKRVSGLMWNLSHLDTNIERSVLISALSTSYISM